MKRFLSFWVVAVIVLVAPFNNADARKKGYGDTLRILAIGNSFSDDGTEYLPNLLENLDIRNVEVARLYVGGCSLEQHWKFYSESQSPYVFYHSPAGVNKWSAVKGYSLIRALEMGQWDIITLQQASGYSGKYDEYYQPYLNNLISLIQKYQPQAEIVWHMTWAYGSGSNHQHFKYYDCSQKTMYNGIVDAVGKVVADTPIERVILSGAALQDLRAGALNNPPLDLTRDGFHLDYGVGRYMAALVWYETLVQPFSHKSMKKNTLRIDKGEIAVTDENVDPIVKSVKGTLKNKNLKNSRQWSRITLK
ncbi:MAG: DUF4886 domain-containing protein [Bacteroidales bacterium]|nr:DUF4886 domain-containing protein [Bacteroidales bacterium]